MVMKKKPPIATPEQFEGNTLMRMITKNIKRVRFVDITLRDTLTLVGGDNDQGKSSLLDSYGFCMGGKLAIDMQPIRNGQQEGSIQCDFGDGQNVKLSVIRTLKRLGESEFTADVDVEIPGHVPPTRIEEFLKKLTGEYAFDPMAFDELKPDAQFETLQKLVGSFDFKKYAEDHKTLYTQRTDAKRDWTREQTAADNIAITVEPPGEREDEQALQNEMIATETRRSNRALGVNQIRTLRESAELAPIRLEEAKREIAEECARTVVRLEEQIAQLQKQIAEARAESEDAVTRAVFRINGERSDAEQKANELQARLDEAPPLPTAEELSAKLTATRELNRKIDHWDSQRKLQNQFQAAANEHKAKWEGLDKRVKDLDAAKDKAITEAQLPVSGIGFGEGYVTLQAEDGAGTIPWAQASEAIRIDASLALAMAMQPKLRVILIRNGSNIGKRIRQRIQQRAAEKGYRVVLEVVEEGEGTHVVIENGEVKGREPQTEGAAA